MPVSMSYNFVTIVSDSGLEDFHLKLDWRQVDKIHIDIHSDWSLSCLENFNGDLKTTAPNLKVLVLKGFVEWNITSLPESLTHLKLECWDETLTIQNLNLAELVRIQSYHFHKNGIDYCGSTPEGLMRSAQKYADDENELDVYNEDAATATTTTTVFFNPGAPQNIAQTVANQEGQNTL